MSEKSDNYYYQSDEYDDDAVYYDIVSSLPVPVQKALHIMELRGDIVIFVDGDYGPRIGTGYKCLVRWANRQCGYTTRLTTVQDDNGDLIVRCDLLRHDALPVLQAFVAAGADFETAYSLVSTSAVGVVTPAEREVAPPRGWTWEQQAQKRALTNAISMAYGQPSLQEMMAEAMALSEGTSPQDWEEASKQLADPDAIAAYAKSLARTRRRSQQIAQLSPDTVEALLRDRTALLHGDDNDEL